MPGTNIYGELIRAQAQSSATDLTGAVAGLFYYNSAIPGIKYYNGAWRSVANLDEAQSFTNKTLGATNILTGATAASFANGGGVTVTLPTVTGTLATLASITQIFAGKTVHNLTGYISESATIFGGILAPASTPPKAVQRITVGEATLGNITNTEGALTTQLIVVNSTASSISVLNDQGSSSSIITGTGGDITLAAGASIIVLYDASSLRWRVVGGSGSGGSATEVVTQTAHGFVVGDALYLNGSVYTKAIATSSNTSSVVGVVSRVQSVNVFEFTSSGKVTGLSGLTVGSDYFLSPTTAGLLTVTEPTTTGHVSQPVGIALSTTSLQVAIKRGVVIGTSNVFTSIGLANTSPTTIQNISSFANGEGGVLTGVLRIDATTDYVFGFEISFTKDIAGVINHSVRYFAGDVLPGISVTVSGQNIQVTLGTLAGFVSATARFQLSASAVSPSLQIDAINISGNGGGGTLPVGSISAYNPGYYTGSNNAGFTISGPSSNTVAAINAYLNARGWYVCDGTALNVPGSLIWNAAGRFLPKLDDTRFLAGASTAGNQAGANSVTLVAGNIPALSGSVTGTGSTVANNTGNVSAGHTHGFATIPTNGGTTPYGFLSFLTGNSVNANVAMPGTTTDASVNHTHAIPSLTVNSGQTVSIPNGAQSAVSILPQYLSTYYIVRVS